MRINRKGGAVVLMLPGENTLILSHEAMVVLVQGAIRRELHDHTPSDTRVINITQQHRKPFRFTIELTQDKEQPEPPHA